jgi:hypothetical protein
LALSTCSLLMIRYNWPHGRMHRFELTLQIVIWIYGLAVTIPFIFYHLYNPTSTACWIASYPHHCGIRKDDEIECIRGEQADTYRAVFAFWPTWPCIILGIFNMLAIYWTVRNLETRNQRYAGRRQSSSIVSSIPNSILSSSPSPPPPPELMAATTTPVTVQLHMANRERSRAVAIQAVFYTAGFLLTFSLDTIVLLWNVINLEADQKLIVAAYILFPLQGTFNFLVYARTSQMHTPEGKFVKKLICRCCRCCWAVHHPTASGSARTLHEQPEQTRDESVKPQSSVELRRAADADDVLVDDVHSSQPVFNKGNDEDVVVTA